jgi:hypothetical protein
LLAPRGADACPPASDFALYPSTLRRIQPELLFAAGTPTACPVVPDASPCGAHRVYLPNSNHPAKREHQLYVFLPGTQSEPDKYDGILRMAAYAGYRTIGLSYDNATRLETACGNQCGCYGPARREVVYGGNPSPAVAVQFGDTIAYRLYRLLDHLDATYPAEGWDAFLSRDDHDGTPELTDIDWDSIVISGHSQGAGHAMVISKAAALDGILLFDGGNDQCTSGGRTYAQWHDLPNNPGPRRSFNHARQGRKDEFELPDSFIAMGFGATSADFDLLDVVWPTAFEVATTNQTPPALCTVHGSMAYDNCMPHTLGGGVPATPADAYLFEFYLDWMCEVGD